MEEIMSHVSKLSAALAAASVLVLSASAAHANVNIPKPIINVPRPVVSVAVPKPAVTSTPISSSVRPGMFAGKPATLQNNVSQWTGPAGAGTQSTTLIYRNGKVVGAISSISRYPATTAPKPGNPTATPANNHPSTTLVASHPAPSTPAPATSHPAPAKPAAAPAPKKITFTPVEYPAFTDQYGTVKGYYVNGKLVMGLTGPSGTACSTGLAYQIPGSSAVSNNYSSGAITVHVVNCTIKS
jgi:hypothetical protein